MKANNKEKGREMSGYKYNKDGTIEFKDRTYFVDHIATVEYRKVVDLKLLILFIIGTLSFLSFTSSSAFSVLSDPMINDWGIVSSSFVVTVLFGFITYVINKGKKSLVIGTSSGDRVELNGATEEIIMDAKRRITNDVLKHKQS